MTHASLATCFWCVRACVPVCMKEGGGGGIKLCEAALNTHQEWLCPQALGNPAKRLKLESFDTIIGKAPNTVHHVCLGPPMEPVQRAALPQWLSTPLTLPRLRSMEPASDGGQGEGLKNIFPTPTHRHNAFQLCWDGYPA